MYNHSSDIDFQDFTNLYKRCNAKQYSYLVIDTTLESDNCLDYFRKNIKFNLTIDDKLKTKNCNILLEKQQKYQRYHPEKLTKINML